MSGLIDKRKRSREADDFCCESTPTLSKRINNLHLTNFEEAHSSNHNRDNDHNKHNVMPKMLFTDQQTVVPVQLAHLKPPVAEGVMEQLQYNPDLDESENPYYYMKNKMLHELHLERLKRCTI